MLNINCKHKIYEICYTIYMPLYKYINYFNKNITYLHLMENDLSNTSQHIYNGNYFNLNI